MKRYFIFLVFQFVTIAALHAQSFKMGFSGNIGIARTVSPDPSLKPAFTFGIPAKKEFTRKWAIESGVFYNNYNHSDYFLTGCAISPFMVDPEPNLDMNYKLQNLHIPFLVDYNLGKGKRKTSVSINSGLGLSTYLTAKRVTTENCQGNVTTSTSSGLDQINPFKVSFLLGFNVNYKLNEKSNLRFSYSYKNYFSGVTKTSFDNSLIIESLGLGYLFTIGKGKEE